MPAISTISWNPHHSPPRARLSTDHDSSVIRLGRTQAVAVAASPIGGEVQWKVIFLSLTSWGAASLLPSGRPDAGGGESLQEATRSNEP